MRVIAALAALLLVVPVASRAQDARPNFVVLLADDLGYGDVERNGASVNRMPNLARMAAEGIRLTSFYVTGNWCMPTRASLLTASYPRRVGLDRGGDTVGTAALRPQRGLHPDEVTLPELLYQAGYATALAGKWHLGDQPEHLPTRHGFDRFFGVVHPNDSGREGFLRWGAMRRSRGGVYGDAVEEIDASVGEVLGALERLGIAERTIVVFTSDNGAGRGWGSNAPLRGFKKTTFEGGFRVPFVVRWPGRVAAGASSDELVTLMDLMPTFARLAGAALPAGRVIDGREVWPILAGAPGARSPHERFLYYDGGRLEAVRDARWKLWLVDTPALYDLETDAGEALDVTESHPDVIARLSVLAEAARRDLGDDAAGLTGAGVRAPGVVEKPRPLTPFVEMAAPASTRQPAGEPPVVPVGVDAYRQWERWPYQRIGVRAYMRSTYDRLGGNHTADASHFLYQEADDFNVTLDVAGAGVLYFARYNHWHGSPWHYEVDGRDHIVQESSTADPRNPVEGSVFLPEHLFPAPLTWTWSTTKGADLMWVPIPFEESFRMAYSRTFYGTGYYIYHQFVDGTPLSRPIESWDGATPPPPDVLELVGRAGSDVAPPAGAGGVEEKSGELRLPSRGTARVWESKRGPRMIRALELSVPEAQALAFSNARLRVTWDGRAEPSIDAPVALFFGAGVLYNRDQREYLVKGFPNVIQYAGGRVHLRCYFPMPFFRSARIEVDGAGAAIDDLRFAVRHAPFADPPNHVGYFHATYRDHPSPEIGQDLVLLDTAKTEGGRDWSGSFVGTSIIFTHDAVLNTLEGDPRFFFDDSQTPQAQGTGTEEWGGGGDYWGGQAMTLPFAGHPVGAPKPEEAKTPEDLIHSEYRFLLADLMPFGRNAVIRFEHGATNLSKEHYQTVTYWYGLPAASLVRTDQLSIGDPVSERAHDYVSPKASEPYELVSRYEWGVDTLERTFDNPPFSDEGREVYPAHSDTGRYTTGASEFTLRTDRSNLGVLLRRKLDYSLPDQRAKVFVAEPGAAAPDWKLAGVWYLAGSNTIVYSYPPDRDELGATQHTVETSNRRFRDDEFLIPRALTAGQSSIRVRVEFDPVVRPLFPQLVSRRPRFTAWSELDYTAYSFVMPEFEP